MNMMNPPSNMPMQPTSHLDEMYPEIYKVMYPAVQNTVNIWIQQIPSPEGLTPSHMDYMVNQVLSLCGLSDPVEEHAQAAALPYYEAQRRREHMQFDRYDRRRHDYRRGRFDFGDLAQILLLQELYRRYGYYPYSAYPYI